MPKFIQITDLHYDPHYYSGPDANEYCHPKQINLLSNIQNNIKSRNEQNNIKSSNGNERYGKPGSECDAPLELLQETLKYIKEFNGLDFVLWTGDSVRHDRDPDWKRSDVDVLEAVRRVSTNLRFQ